MAALTMPALVANYQKNVTVTRLKKYYTLHMQSYNLMVTDNGCDFENSSEQTDNPDFAAEYIDCRFKPYLKTLNIKKTLKGALLAFPDGSGLYVRKNLFGSSWSTYLVNMFCVDYKDCENINESANLNIYDGKKMFYFTNSGPGQGSNQDRANLRSRCASSADNGCAQLIIMDGWEIKDDYPW